MKDRDSNRSNHTNDRWAAFRAVGLVRSGVHTDTQVTATTPSGEAVVMDVKPITINGGKDTLFAYQPWETAKMTQVFPRPPRTAL